MSETRQCMKLRLIDEKPSIFGSRIGGVGYLPHEMDVPTNKQGNQLRLLAQINCADVELDNFPKQGLLQFWILNDTLLGMNFDEPNLQDGFRVVYHPFVDKTVTETELTFKVFGNPFDDDEQFPVKDEFGVEMIRTEESSDGYADEDCPMSGHKIGGFPLIDKRDSRSFLLLQLDSDFLSEANSDGNFVFREKVMWGDAGTAQFFIEREALKLLDFSDVSYYWDNR